MTARVGRFRGPSSSPPAPGESTRHLEFRALLRGSSQTRGLRRSSSASWVHRPVVNISALFEVLARNDLRGGSSVGTYRRERQGRWRGDAGLARLLKPAGERLERVAHSASLDIAGPTGARLVASTPPKANSAAAAARVVVIGPATAEIRGQG